MKQRIYNTLVLVMNTFFYNGFVRAMRVFYYAAIIVLFRPVWVMRKRFRLFGMTFHYNSVGSLIILISEMYMHGVYSFKPKSDKPVIFDIGANVGDTLLYFKHFHPNAEVHCFEPTSKAFELLEKNMEVNGFEDVYVNNVALSNEDGEMEMHIDDTETYVSSSSHQSFVENIAEKLEGGVSSVERVKVRSFADYVIENNVEHIDMLKIDIEGGEGAVIEDAVRVLDRIDEIVLEFHWLDDLSKNSFDRMVSLLREGGFAVRFFDVYRDPYQWQGQDTFMVKAERM